MRENRWEQWQLDLLDRYIMGYVHYESQEEFAEEIGKPLNAVKIKLTRRRNELGNIPQQQLSFNQYQIFLSNRFDKTTSEIAEILGVATEFLSEEIDDIDALEAKEDLEEGFADRIMSLEEILLLSKLHSKGYKEFQIAHILNRPVEKIMEALES